jgi:hypothetical protein
MAVQIVQNLSVAANAVSAEQMSGPNETLRGYAGLRFLAAAAAVGLNATLLAGERILVNDQPVSQANRFPIYPDDFVTDDAGYPAERLSLRFRNTTAGAIIVNAKLEIGYVG